MRSGLSRAARSANVQLDMARAESQEAAPLRKSAPLRAKVRLVKRRECLEQNCVYWRSVADLRAISISRRNMAFMRVW